MDKKTQLQISTWALGIIAVVISCAAWIFSSAQGPLTLQTIFPLLGLTAFSLMWSHYVSGVFVKKLGQSSKVIAPYFQITGIIVLALIVLHPGIFYLDLYMKGLGTPPFSSFEAYTGLIQRTAIVVAYVSFTAFIAYEFHRKFKKKSWWKYIEYANLVAMLGIFFHAFVLGDALLLPWFRIVWVIYGVIFVASVIYTYTYDRRHPEITKLA